MGLPAVAFCLITAVLPLLWLPALPEISGIVAIIVAGCLLGGWPRVRWLALWLLFFAWGLLAAQEAVWPAKALPGATQRAVVKIVATDNMTAHRGIIEQLDGRRQAALPCAGDQALRAVSASARVCWPALGDDAESAGRTWAA